MSSGLSLWAHRFNCQKRMKWDKWTDRCRKMVISTILTCWTGTFEDDIDGQEKNQSWQCGYQMIWYFWHGQADHPVNVDSKSYKITEENMGHPDRQDIAMHLMMMMMMKMGMLLMTWMIIYLVTGGLLTSPVLIFITLWPVTAIQGEHEHHNIIIARARNMLNDTMLLNSSKYNIIVLTFFLAFDI